MDADSLVHIAHPRDSITRVSTISMLRYGPEAALPRILQRYRRFGLKQTFFVPAWCIERYPGRSRRWCGTATRSASTATSVPLSGKGWTLAARRR